MGKENTPIHIAQSTRLCCGSYKLSLDVDLRAVTTEFTLLLLLHPTPLYFFCLDCIQQKSELLDQSGESTFHPLSDLSQLHDPPPTVEPPLLPRLSQRVGVQYNSQASSPLVKVIYREAHCLNTLQCR